MCSTRHVLACMLACAVLEVACGLASLALGAASVALAVRGAQPVRLGNAAPLWSGACFLLCGVCGVFCAKRKSGRLMILFSALCICGLIAGILSFRFVWAHDHEGGTPNLTATAGTGTGSTPDTRVGLTADDTAADAGSGTTAGGAASAGTASSAGSANRSAAQPPQPPPLQQQPQPAPGTPHERRSWRWSAGGRVSVASLSVAGVGVAGCAASAWLTCRLASNEQRRMFVEMEHSLHHTHELTEKELAEVLNNGISPVSQGSKSF